MPESPPTQLAAVPLDATVTSLIFMTGLRFDGLRGLAAMSCPAVVVDVVVVVMVAVLWVAGGGGGGVCRRGRVVGGWRL